jgi:hypothetical protein
MGKLTQKSLSDRFRIEDSTMKLIVFTLVGVTLQTAFTIPSMFCTIYNFAGPPSMYYSACSPVYPFPPSYIWPTVETIMALYVLVPLAVCAFISSLFKPKRIVSMVYVQLTTVTVFGLLVLVGVSASSANLHEDYLTFAGVFGVVWAVYLLLFGILGFFETVLIKWLIGVNEGKLEPETFSVTLDFDRLRDLILKEFRNSFELRVERNELSLLVVRTVGKWRVVLGIGPDRADSSKSILCLVPYEYGFYEISTTNEARKLRNDVLLNLQGRLVDKAKVTPTNDDPIVTTTTHSIAIQPTLTKYAVTKELWKKVPTGFKYALGATALAWVLITILFEEQLMLKTTIEFSAYLELSVLLFLAAVAELGIPLWQELREARRVEPILSPSS